MKTQLLVSALLVVGLGLVGGTLVVSAAPPQECAVGTVLGECEFTLEATQINPNSIDSRVPALAPELEVQTRVYQYDPDSDAFTWFQFPSQTQAAASISAAPDTAAVGNSISVPRDPLFLGDNGD